MQILRQFCIKLMQMGADPAAVRPNTRRAAPFVKRFAQSEDGGPATEAALLLALVAAIAGFGMIFLGEALSAFYTAAGESFSPGAQFPTQPSGL